MGEQLEHDTANQDEWLERIEKLKELQDFVSLQMNNEFDRQKLQYDKRRRHVTFQIGDKVMCKKQITSSASKGISRAFGGKNQGPFTVIRILGPSVYEIATEEGRSLGRYPIKLLIPYRDSR